jgi:hypothetical protein
LFIFARLTQIRARTLVSASAAGAETQGSYLSDDLVAEANSFVSSYQGVKVVQKFFAEVMDLLEQHVPGCRVLLRGD